MHPAVALALAYASGSFPSAWLAGRWSGVDLRAQGSGNLGATNVLRVLGPRIGATVFLVDIAKGFLPVYFLAPLTATSGDGFTLIQILCGAAAVLGHARPLFLGLGKGGKGVATACGVFLAVAPMHTVFGLVTFAVVVLSSGHVSLASLTGTLALPVMFGATFGITSLMFSVGILTLAFVAYTHRDNIRRLSSGTEYRFERSAKLGMGTSLAMGLVVIAAATAFLVTRAP